MPFPIGPDPRTSESESDFLIQDPFGLRRAITPVFAFDIKDGMLTEPRHGLSIGLGTSFYVTPYGHQLSAMHIAAKFFSAQNVPIRTGPEKNILEQKETRVGIFQDPRLVFGAAPAGEVLYANDFVMFPVDQSQHPLAFSFTPERLSRVEPTLDLIAWDILGLRDRNTVYLPIRVSCSSPSVAEGDRVLAIGYPEIQSWRRPGTQLVTYQEQMRGSIGRVLKLDRAWDQSRKIWPTISVDAHWKPGMSGGPVFNEAGEVVGIVSRSVDFEDKSQGWSSALWLEPLPFRQDIYGSIDHRNPGWIVGWGACNAHSVIRLFPTENAAAAFVQKTGPRLAVRNVSAIHPMLLKRQDGRRPGASAVV